MLLDPLFPYPTSIQYEKEHDSDLVHGNFMLAKINDSLLACFDWMRNSLALFKVTLSHSSWLEPSDLFYSNDQISEVFCIKCCISPRATCQVSTEWLQQLLRFLNATCSFLMPHELLIVQDL